MSKVIFTNVRDDASVTAQRSIANTPQGNTTRHIGGDTPSAAPIDTHRATSSRAHRVTSNNAHHVANQATGAAPHRSTQSGTNDSASFTNQHSAHRVVPGTARSVTPPVTHTTLGSGDNINISKSTNTTTASSSPNISDINTTGVSTTISDSPAGSPAENHSHTNETGSTTPATVSTTASTIGNTAKTPSDVVSDTMVFMNTPGKKATIRDVARLAGVSYGTVSRYLNGSNHVSGDAAQRIAQAIKDAQYTPNNAARSLAQRRTLTVALIIQVESRETIVQASTSSAMAGANQVLGDAGYQMVTVIANTEESTKRIAQLVQSDFADGYLLFALSNDASLEQTFLTTKRPVVGSEINDPEKVVFPTVDFTNEEGQRSITQYLINKGRTRLLYICGPGYSSAAMNRMRGFRAAVGDDFREEHVYYADDWEISSGELAIAEFQNKLPDIDGVVCANDNIAVGAINQLNRMGYRVPEDIAVTGFDDSPMALLANPKLTTVRQDSLLHGETMAKLLLEMLNGKTVAKNYTVLLPTSILERQSA